MSDWLTLQQLADLALPGFPATRRGWDCVAERESWDARAGLVRPRGGKGGGLEYHIDILSPDALAALVAKRVGVVDATGETASGCDEQLSLPMDESRDARMAVLGAADRLARDGGMSRRDADRIFASLYNMERIDVAPWVRGQIRQTSAKTLERWRSIAKRDRARLSVDRGAARRGKGAFDAVEEGKVRAFLLARVAHSQFLSARHMQSLLRDKFPHVYGPGQPSLRSLQHYLSQLKTQNQQLLTRLQNPDKWKSAYRVSGRNSHAVERLNELWQIDASPADALCVDGRHSIYVCIDISRAACASMSRARRAPRPSRSSCARPSSNGARRSV